MTLWPCAGRWRAALAGGLVGAATITGAAGAAVGDLTPAGCIHQTGNAESCASAASGLGAPRAVAVSPDGRQVYVAGTRSATVSWFARERVRGMLTPLACVGQIGSSEPCGAHSQGIDSPVALAFSPNGATLYVASAQGTITGFARDRVSGTLREVGCIAAASAGSPACPFRAEGLGSPASIAVSSDGANVYVAAAESNAIVTLRRDRRYGGLRSVGCIKDEGTAEPCDATAVGLRSPRSVAVSPDGRNVYVASLGSSAVTALARDPRTGRLRRVACIADAGSDTACAQRTANLAQTDRLAVSSDGLNVYALSFTQNTVVSLRRDPLSGHLAPAGCVTQLPPNSGEPCAGVYSGGLELPRGLAVSADGRSVYVVSDMSDAIAAFGREAGTGALRPLGCITEAGITENPRSPRYDSCPHTTLGLDGAAAVAVSPEGGNVYVASAPGGRAADALTTFVREATRPTLQSDAAIARRRKALRRFRRFGLYDVGGRWGRLRQSAIGDPTSAPAPTPGLGYGFLYGPCVSPPGSGTCHPALEIDNFSLCSVNLASESFPPDRLTKMRGVPVAVFAPGGDFDRLELFTGRTTVVVRTGSLAEARRAVAALRTLNGRARGPRKRLPAPLKGPLGAMPRGC